MTSIDNKKITMDPPELMNLLFQRKDGKAPGDVKMELPVAAKLELFRLAKNKLGVALELEISDYPLAEIKATFRAPFTVEDVDDDKLDDVLTEIAAHMAPAAIYPYIRETISSVSLKAGLKPIVLPVVDFRDVFSVSSIKIPSLQKTAGEKVRKAKKRV